MELRKYIILFFIFFTSCFVSSQELLRDEIFMDSISDYEEIVKQIEELNNYIEKYNKENIHIEEKGIDIYYGKDSSYVAKSDEIRRIKRIEYYLIINTADNSIKFSIEKYIKENENLIFIIILSFHEGYEKKRIKLIWDPINKQYIVKTGKDALKYN